MGFKELFGLTVIPAAAFGASMAACVSQRVRDLFFIALVFFSPLIERLDVNFVSREWYRGTMRGFEISILDVLFVALLVSSVLVPRRGHVRAFWPASLAPMLFYFLYACGNVLANEPKLFGYFERFICKANASCACWYSVWRRWFATKVCWPWNRGMLRDCIAFPGRLTTPTVFQFLYV
jgi:hypothetical protein